MSLLIQPDEIYLREGEYIVLPIEADFPIVGVINRLGLKAKKVKDNLWILEGYPVRQATERQPLYITVFANPDYGGEDFNIKVVVQGYDGISNSSFQE